MTDISEKRQEGRFDESDGRAGVLMPQTVTGLLKDEHINLLVKVDELGSIVRAAKVIGISYKIAWDTIITLSNDFGEPLVRRFTIGKMDGVTRLTNEGRKIISRFAAKTENEDNFESQRV